MGIALKRLGPHGVNLVIAKGRIGRDELIGLYRGLDPQDPANALPWLGYLAPDADFSGVDVLAYAELKRILMPLRAHVERTGRYHSVIVSNSERCDQLVKFWHDFIALDSGNPPYTVLYKDIHGACEGLDLPGSAAGAIIEAIEAHQDRPPIGEAPALSADRT